MTSVPRVMTSLRMESGRSSRAAETAIGPRPAISQVSPGLVSPAMSAERSTRRIARWRRFSRAGCFGAMRSGPANPGGSTSTGGSAEPGGSATPGAPRGHVASGVQPGTGVPGRCLVCWEPSPLSTLSPLPRLSLRPLGARLAPRCPWHSPSPSPPPSPFLLPECSQIKLQLHLRQRRRNLPEV